MYPSVIKFTRKIYKLLRKELYLFTTKFSGLLCGQLLWSVLIWYCQLYAKCLFVCFDNTFAFQWLMCKERTKSFYLFFLAKSPHQLIKISLIAKGVCTSQGLENTLWEWMIFQIIWWALWEGGNLACCTRRNACLTKHHINEVNYYFSILGEIRM